MASSSQPGSFKKDASFKGMDGSSFKRRMTVEESALGGQKQGKQKRGKGVQFKFIDSAPVPAASKLRSSVERLLLQLQLYTINI